MKLALWRLGAGLIALPAQVISVFLVFHGAAEAVGPLYHRLLPSADRRPRRARQGAALFGCLLVGVPVAAAMTGAAVVVLISGARMLYYPFWALAARPADLRHAAGGPTPLGATLVCWLAGAVLVGVGDLVLRGGGYLLRRLVFAPLLRPVAASRGADRRTGAPRSEDQPAPLRPPGPARRASGRAGRPGTARPR